MIKRCPFSSYKCDEGCALHDVDGCAFNRAADALEAAASHLNEISIHSGAAGAADTHKVQKTCICNGKEYTYVVEEGGRR